jgi:lysophospholipid hydrolase
MYTKYQPEPQRQEPQVEVFPEAPEGDSKRGLSNYLDEFLSAIKVFGYLERPVFHELTRTMQTRRLIAGETLSLEEEKGFCLVVDGMVQIFVKSMSRDISESSIALDGSDDEEHHDNTQGYQLLSEVRNGAPLSSLFSILSLFTEDIKLRHGDEEDSKSPGFANGHIRSYDGAVTPDSRPQTPLDLPDTPPSHAFQHRRDLSAPVIPTEPDRLPRIPPLRLDSMDSKTAELRNSPMQAAPSRPRVPKTVHPDIVARATVDTTIAIIPATAFRRLTRVYPRATAHIVQVILTRLQRVTLSTAHAYLGLTSEVVRTEKLMNKYTTYDLPEFLKDAPLQRLKEKFTKERERIGPEEGRKGIALHNPNAGRRRRASSGLRKEAAVQARLAINRANASTRSPADAHLRVSSPDQNERAGVSAGDLLTNTHVPRVGARYSRLSFSQPYQTPATARNLRIPHEVSSGRQFVPPLTSRVPLQRQESIDEDRVFRESILDCMFKAIGLTEEKQTASRPVSVEQSPRLVSFDSKRQKAVFSSSFPFIDPYEISQDGESESIASASVSAFSTSGPHLEELANDMEIVFFPQGSVLVEQGERNPGLYYVIDGFLDISVQLEDDISESGLLGNSQSSGMLSTTDLFGERNLRRSNTDRSRTASIGRTSDSGRKRAQKRRSLFLTKPGGLAGYLGAITSYRSFIDVSAKTDVYVGFLPRASIERIVEQYPAVLLTMAKRLTTLLPRLILHMDFALEWVQVNAGQVIYNQDDESDAIYIVLNGRLRAIRENEKSGNQFIGEFGQGDSIGELEVLTESPRPGSLHAIRDTELAKFPKTLFNSLALEHAGITIQISKMIATRMRSFLDGPLREPGRERTAAKSKNSVSSNVNLRTIAILPVTAGVPVVEFGSRLMNAFSQIGTPNGVVSLNQTTILNHLGRLAFNRMGKLKLAQYLADLEEKYGMVLYVVDTNVKSPWTQTCISQADCILLVGTSESSPNLGEYERFLLTTKTTARKELILLHMERYCPPGLTRKWLRNRPWVNGSHHHIHMSFRTTPEPVHPPTKRFGSEIKRRVQTLQAEIQKYTSRKVRQTPLYSADTPFKGDFHRLARRLSGKAVGLVLGGGGARGCAHVGIIRALEESGIPIDIVGGTSIGAFIGALYAWDADVVPMYGRAKKFAGRMGSMWRFALDLTYPS